MAHSTDGGRTWKVVYADKVSQDSSGCSFTQYIGSQPLVLADGTLDVAAEKISTVDPNCNGAPLEFSEVMFTSTDGGHTFSNGQKIASVTPAFADGALTLGPGELMRTIEFPTIAEPGRGPLRRRGMTVDARTTATSPSRPPRMADTPGT